MFGFEPRKTNGSFPFGMPSSLETHPCFSQFLLHTDVIQTSKFHHAKKTSRCISFKLGLGSVPGYLTTYLRQIFYILSVFPGLPPNRTLANFRPIGL